MKKKVLRERRAKVTEAKPEVVVEVKKKRASKKKEA